MIQPVSIVDVDQVNLLDLGVRQKNPASLHAFDDGLNLERTDTQVYITQHNELILIAGAPDIVCGTYAEQVQTPP
ncbi:hypothetical protein J2X66_005864 [Pseudomonas sp. 3296]|uniref:hypothetical protein n=1 Tax=Pseudomonas sp. 3296 TaxID=2817753 RepID=UPI0028558549|nr:hypothetical protein [Pseudomonas sp. 3296]MDR6918959.1 hypothetical protein [Pseudomonas sp. 3296]